MRLQTTQKLRALEILDIYAWVHYRHVQVTRGCHYNSRLYEKNRIGGGAALYDMAIVISLITYCAPGAGKVHADYVQGRHHLHLGVSIIHAAVPVCHVQ